MEVESYRRRRPEESVLYRVVRDHLATFLEMASFRSGGKNLPTYVRQEFERDPDCGILANGFVAPDYVQQLSHARAGGLPEARPCKTRPAGWKRRSEMADELIQVSENYWWHESRGEFVRGADGTCFPDFAFEAKVLVYEDRVLCWFLEFAHSQVEKGATPGDYVALSVALAYIEGVEQYRQGTDTPARQAGGWSCLSASRIFPGVPNGILKRIWKEARCGLFHCGFTNGPTYVSRERDEPLWMKGDRLVLNPIRFLDSAISDFKAYLGHLREHPSDDLAKNFVKLWDDRWNES